MTDQPVKLLTPDEIAAMRTNLEGVIQVSEHEWRVQATLEELIRIAHDRLDALIDAQAERDTWRAEAEDQRAAVLRLETERDRLLVANGALVRASRKPKKIKLLRDGGTGLPGEAVGGE